MTYLSPDPFGGFTDDGRKRQYWEVESLLPSRPFINDLSTKIAEDDGKGYWYVDDCLHSRNTYGELLFWEWMAKSGINVDKIAVTRQKMGIKLGSPGCSPETLWQFESYRSFLRNECPLRYSLSGTPWSNRFSFLNDHDENKSFWTVPVHTAQIVRNATSDQEITTNAELTNIGWALWRVTREFKGRVGLFHGSFVCSDETDSVVLAPYCEMLGVFRSVPEGNAATEGFV